MRFDFKRNFLFWMLAASVALAGTTGNDKNPAIGPDHGWLIVHGGGRVTPEVKKRFIELAGGLDAQFVVIPTANGTVDLNRDREAFAREFGVEHVTVLHTTDRNRANSEEFVAPLKHASAIWINGGRQWRLADAYLGTAVEREIKALLARGGVVGGGSAGATIQGSYLVRGASAIPGNPDGDNTIMMSPGHEKGFGLLRNSAIDQHVIVRHREGDLDPVIAAHPDLLGIGIDEGASIVVHGNAFEVAAGKVIIHDGKKHESGRYYFLSTGQTFNLLTRTAQ